MLFYGINGVLGDWLGCVVKVKCCLLGNLKVDFSVFCVRWNCMSIKLLIFGLFVWY